MDKDFKLVIYVFICTMLLITGILSAIAGVMHEKWTVILGLTTLFLGIKGLSRIKPN